MAYVYRKSIGKNDNMQTFIFEEIELNFNQKVARNSLGVISLFYDSVENAKKKEA